MKSYRVDPSEASIIPFASALVPIIQEICGQPQGAFDEAAARSSEEYILGDSRSGLVCVRLGYCQEFFTVDLLTLKRLTLRVALAIEDIPSSHVELRVELDGEDDEVSVMEQAIAPLIDSIWLDKPSS